MAKHDWSYDTGRGICMDGKRVVSVDREVDPHSGNGLMSPVAVDELTHRIVRLLNANEASASGEVLSIDVTVDGIIERLRGDHVMYTLDMLDEEDKPEDHFSEAADAEWVRNQLQAGNEWAWFCAKVTARITIEGVELKGYDYLGGCSYESREAFESDAYYTDMKDGALRQIAENLHAMLRVLRTLLNGKV